MWERKITSWIVRRRYAVLAAMVVVTVVAGIFAARVGYDSSLEVWFLEDDPALASYQAFLERFEADEILVLGLFSRESVFTPTALDTLAQLTNAAGNAPHVHHVHSLVNVHTIGPGEAAGSIRIGPIYDAPPRSVTAAQALQKRVLSDPLLRGRLISADGRAAAILVEMDPAGNTFEGKVALVETLRADAQEIVAGGDLEVRMAGSPHIDWAFLKYSKRDYMLLGPLAVVVVLALAWLIFRRLWAALIPLLVVLTANVWVFGLMGWMGVDVNIVSSALSALLIAVGVADAVHVIADYDRELMHGATRLEAVKNGLTHVFSPCLFTSITTAAGFLSLLTSDLKPVREFGWLAAFGVLAAFVLSMTLIPAVLGRLRPPHPARVERAKHGPFTRTLQRLGRPQHSIAAAMLVATGVTTAVSGWMLASRLEVGADVMNYFRAGDPVRQDTLAVDRALGGSTSVELLVHASGEGFKDPAVLERLAALESHLEQQPGIRGVFSILDLLRATHAAMMGIAPDAAELPNSAPLIAQYYLLLEGKKGFDALLQDDGHVGRMTVRVNLSDAGWIVDMMPELETLLAEQYDDEQLRVRATGYIKLMESMEVYLLRSQIRSFLAAFIVITLLMFLVLRSVKLGLFAMLPNLLPIVIGLGAMATFGIPLDPGTVMIAGIALGLVVDDTVHLFFRLRRQLSVGASFQEALAHSVEAAGRAITITSIVLAVGFSILMFGSFTPNIHFGMITALVVLIAWVVDLVAVPAVLTLLRPRIKQR